MCRATPTGPSTNASTDSPGPRSCRNQSRPTGWLGKSQRYWNRADILRDDKALETTPPLPLCDWERGVLLECLTITKWRPEAEAASSSYVFRPVRGTRGF